ncbi:cytochrome P450 81E8-like [Senna tora]|uniref:Cytochrome P450 81E8-like n=1 Tax=Senna tora TaxID=362788 RepID=A0A834TUS3_9FABA|nr:cytochrome P450 81E8-like [Senna tora]
MRNRSRKRRRSGIWSGQRGKHITAFVREARSPPQDESPNHYSASSHSSSIIIMTSLIYYSLLLLASLLALKLLLKPRRFKNIPPGPFSLPIIGNLHQLKTPLFRNLPSFSQRYGPILSLWFGSRLAVVVSSLSAAQECFTKNDVVLANRPRFLTGKYLAYNNTTVILSPYGDHWRNLRRILALEVLSTHRLDSFLGMRRDEIKRLIQKLARGSHAEFARVELRSMFSEMTFNATMRMVSGKRYWGDDCEVGDVEEAKKFREIVKEFMSTGGTNNLGEFLPILRWFDFGKYENKLKSLGTRVDVLLQALIDEHRNGNQSANSMIDHLLALQQSQPEYYTDEIIKGLVLSLLLAGTDTSAVTLEWAFSNLLNHPEVLKKAKEEIDTHIGQERLINETDILELPYLQNIISETIRLYPATPMLLPHEPSSDCIIGGYNVPRGTMVLVNAWAIHRDPQLWIDPTSFKPERFEKEGEANKLIPFGLGRRACPGSNLAQRTVGLTLGLMIQCFDWKRVSNEEIDMTERVAVTLLKQFPLIAMCKGRQPIIQKVISCVIGY